MQVKPLRNFLKGKTNYLSSWTIIIINQLVNPPRFNLNLGGLNPGSMMRPKVNPEVNPDIFINFKTKC